MKNKKQSLFKTVIGMMISPARIVKDAMNNTKWYLSVLISALAFSLFFIQTGLDLYKTGQKGIDFVVLSTVAGLGYGAIIIPMLAILMGLILKLSKSTMDIKTTICSFCLSYSGALIYGILGILFSFIFGWKTSVAFGVTGVLWAIGPMIVSIRELSKGKNKLSIPIATIVSVIVLTTWSMFGNL